MFKSHQLLRQLALFVVLIIITGTIGYRHIEKGWSYFDGFYMTLITLTTIGFSEVHTLTTAGRWLTVFIVVFGLGAAATILSQLAQLMLDGDLAETWRKRRMDKKVSRLRDHVIICGYGRIGQAISADLSAMGVPCVIIDRDDDRNHGAQTHRLPTISGNATSDVTLIQAGVERASVLVAALSNDSDNLFVALAARDLNRNLVVIARGEDKSIETRMLRAGVDRVVYPAQLGGGQIARLVTAELGHDLDEQRTRRVSDVMGYDLQVYRNFKRSGITVAEILASTDAIQVVTHIDQEGQRHRLPADQHVVGPEETVLLLTEVATSREQVTEIISLADLALGVTAIDEEHLQILKLIERVRRPDVDLGEILKELRDYLGRHFLHEEQLLHASEYPEVEAHVALHRELSARVNQLLADGENLHRDNVSRLLEDWIRDHIHVEDRRYADHLLAVRN